MMLFIAPAMAQETTLVNGREFILHVVKPKETVYGISKHYNVPQDTIYAYNKSALQGIKIDEVLKFPSEKGMQTIVQEPVKNNTNTGKTTTHVVKQGETIYGLCKQYQVTSDELIAYNPQLKDGLKIDEVLQIPLKEGVVLNTVVQDKDTRYIHPNSSCDGVVNKDKDLKIALLLPFHTSKGINTRIAVEFFAGFRAAVDSLSDKGFNITLLVYDTKSKSDSDQVADILTKPEFEEVDMIIGPLYTANLQPVADYAERRKILVVSPFARNSSILTNNHYVCKTTPSEETVSRKSVKYFITFYPGANYIMVDPGSRKDSVITSYYVSALKESGIKDTARLHYVSLKTGGAVSKLRKDSRNIIFFPCSKEITVKDYMTKLNKSVQEKYDISLVGLEDWLEFDNVEAGYYENLNLHIPAVSYFSYTDSANYAFIRQYQKQMKTDPTMYSYRGYQIASYMIQAWMKYGASCGECIQQVIDCENCPVPFEFIRPDQYSGFESQTIQMMYFSNYQYRIRSY